MGREEGSRDVGRADGSTQPVKHLGERLELSSSIDGFCCLLMTPEMLRIF